MGRLPSHITIPQDSGGYAALREIDWFVILPEETINLLKNPSLEEANFPIPWEPYGTGATGGVVYTDQRRGVASYQVTLSGSDVQGRGVRYNSLGELKGSTLYTFSLDVKANGGRLLRMWVANTLGSWTSQTKDFYAAGFWERKSLTFKTPAKDTYLFYLVVSPNDQSGAGLDYWIDGAQLEEKPYPTTYCDGEQEGVLDLPGDPAYAWLGAPHRSQSRRSPRTRAGGRLVRLSDLGFAVSGVLGLGMPPVAVQVAPYGNMDGGLYQGAVTPPREFSLVGSVSGGSLTELRRKLADLESVLSSDRTAPRQPLLLVARLLGANGAPIQEDREIQAIYVGGLEGALESPYQQKVAVSLVMPDPHIRAGGEDGTSVAARGSLTINHIVMRSPDGEWSALSGGANGTVTSVLKVGDLYYIAGDFTQIGGVAITRVASFDPATGQFASLGGVGPNASVYALVPSLDGTQIYVLGAFTQVGALTARRAAVYTISAGTWAELGNGLDNGIAYSGVRVPGGPLYITGSFTTAGGGATTLNGVAVLSGGSWLPVGSGLAGGAATGNRIIQPALNAIYICGSFTTAGGVTVNNITKTNGSTYFALGSGANLPVRRMAWLNDRLYVLGDFSQIGGIPASKAAYWEGTRWVSWGQGITNSPGAGGIWVGDDGLLYVSMFDGSPVEWGGDPTIRTFTWDGQRWYPFEISTRGNETGLFIGPDGRMFLTSLVTGTPGYVPYVVTINNRGQARTFPKLRFRGRGHLVSVKNLTTRRALYFTASVETNEVLDLTLSPTKVSLLSSHRGNRFSAIIPGSDIGDFFLQPGANRISVFVDEYGGAPTSNVEIRFRRQFMSLNSPDAPRRGEVMGPT